MEMMPRMPPPSQESSFRETVSLSFKFILFPGT